MDSFNKFSLVQTEFLLANTKVDVKRLFKFAFLDLVIKGVLAPRQEIKTSGKNGRSRKLLYFVAGPSFKGYRPLHYEMIFLEPFKKKWNIKVLFQHLIHIGSENLEKSPGFIKEILLNKGALKGLFTTNFIYKAFLPYQLSYLGNEMRLKILEEKSQLEKELPTLIKEDPKKAVAIISAISGNLLLLDGISLKSLQGLGKEFEFLTGRIQGFNPQLLENNGIWLDVFDAVFDVFDAYDFVSNAIGGVHFDFDLGFVGEFIAAS